MYDAPSMLALMASNRHLLITGFLSFILIGAVQAMYGPAFPALQERYGLDTASVGLIVSFHFIGSIITILLSGALVTRFGYRRVLSTGSLLMLLGSLGVAFSSSWSLSLAAAFLIGLGFGAIDVGSNLLFARRFGAKAAPALNLLNAMFGLGAVLGPLFVSIFLPSVKWPFLVIAALALVSTLLCSQLANTETLNIKTTRQTVFPFWSLTSFILIYFFYASSEVGAASWETTHLAPYYGEKQAAFFTSIYWAALTVGRFIAAPLSAYIKPAHMVLGASVLGFLSIVTAHSIPFAPYAYALTGLAFAPIFPTALVWLQEVLGGAAERFTSLLFVAATFGAVVATPAIGLIIEKSSSNIVPTTMSVLTLIMLIVTLSLWLGSRKPSSAKT